ncbi:MAG: DUF1593 domain-containing protein [Bacteroidales bacterium]|nr:DUF1593 domain-containing protein [Bacteroidales bacterium]
MRFRLLCSIAAAVLVISSCSEKATVKPRIIVTCDPELDDHNSLIRYLLYSTDYDTEGLIYASSQVHWKGDGKGTPQYREGSEYARMGLGPQTSWRWAEGERFIHEDVEAYAKVYPNLKVHNPNYPSPDKLLSLIYEGNVAFESDISEDTPGSDRIKEVLLDDDPRPVFVQVWGGPSTVSRALKSIEEEYSGTPEWDAIKKKVSAKCKLCLSGAQDTSFRDYVKPNWPDVESIIINAGVTPIGYGAARGVQTPSDTLYYSAQWTADNISSKGILGSLYRVWGDGKQMAPGDMTDYFGLSGYSMDELRAMGYNVWTATRPKGSFISEGDTPEFLNLIGNGLRACEAPEWGGWAGRMKELSDREKQAGYTAPFGARGGKDAVLPDFVPAVQNGFASRMQWSVTPDFGAANHEPVIKGVKDLSVKAGSDVKISQKVSDPDGDALTCGWAQWKVLGSFQGDVAIQNPNSSNITVSVPGDAAPGDKIHLILTVEDNGSPKLTSYQRVILTVK